LSHPKPFEKTRFNAASLLLAVIGVIGLPLFSHGVEPIKPKVMVIATYETGKDRGDVPGELQYWIERENSIEQSRCLESVTPS